MLKIQNITKIFNPNSVDQKMAIDNLSLTVNDGDFITVIGTNGAGKSTLLNIIAGDIIVDSGSIKIDDTDITYLPTFKRASFLGRVFQDPRLGTATDMEIEENLALAKRRGNKRGLRWGVKETERAEYVEMLKALNLGLETRLNAKVGLLSGGQRQAITLLMASMNKPKLLLLDEHTAALDPKTAKKVLEITEKIVTDNKLSTIMVTHNMKDALEHGNRLIMMDAGRIIYDVSGKEKENLTVEDLLNKFSNSESSLSDSTILSK